MTYRTLLSAVNDLKKIGELTVVEEEIDPRLEMAAIQRRAYTQGLPALLFTKPKGCRFPMLANLFGSMKRIEYLFRDGIEPLRNAMQLGTDTVADVFKNLWSLKRRLPSLGMSAWYSRPKFVTKKYAPVLACRTTIDALPQLVSWPDDGGPYITLPQIYTESVEHPGFARSNLGMYRVQLSGNDYRRNEEVGLHYQIHRGIAIHHAEAIANDTPLPVNIFVGGAPAMTLAAVMPLPENVSELFFAGMLARHRIPMIWYENVPLPIYAEADFCITGFLEQKLKREGPFGDHLGYYSLGHDFPVLRVTNVFHRKDAIWPFTVVGRPPQEDSMFGKFIHNITGDLVTKMLPRVAAVHAVDEAGVHPLLLAVGRESYLPYNTEKRAAELHTLAQSILGFGQMSLAKYLLLVDQAEIDIRDVYNVEKFLLHVLRRVDWRRDLHFVTKTTADTLDYSSPEPIHFGSKCYVAVCGDKPVRELRAEFNDADYPTIRFKNPRVALPGVLCAENVSADFEAISSDDAERLLADFPLIVLVDDTGQVASFKDFLWTTFTKSDPATDIDGVGSFVHYKHWGCTGSLVIDAKRKPHHAPELVEPEEIARRADNIFQRLR